MRAPFTALLCVSGLLSTSLAAAEEPQYDAAGNVEHGYQFPTPAEPALPALRGTPAWSEFGPSGGDVFALTVSPTTAGLAIAGTRNVFGQGGVFRTTNNGTSWSSIASTGTRAINDADASSSGAFYVATSDGLFASTDNGVSFSEIALPTEPRSQIRAVATESANPGAVWVGLGQLLNGTDPTVLLRSPDNGATWEDRSPPVIPGQGAAAIEVDPANPLRVFALFSASATSGGGGSAWFSSDGGVTWFDRTSGLPPWPMWDVEFSGSRVYLVGGQDFGSQFVGLYASDDDGATWIELSDNTWPSLAVTAVAIDPVNPLTIFVGTQRAGLGRSTDGGLTWTFSYGGTGSFPINRISYSSTNPGTVFVGGNAIPVRRSIDNGVNFATASTGINRLTYAAIAVNPLDSDEIVMAYENANDGGIFITLDGGDTWTLSQAPLPRWRKLIYAADGTLYGVHNGPGGRAREGVWRREADGTWTTIGPYGPSAPPVINHSGNDFAITPGPNAVGLFAGFEGAAGGQDSVIWTLNRAGSGVWAKEYESNISISQTWFVRWVETGLGRVGVAGRVFTGSAGQGTPAVLRSTDDGDNWVVSETGFTTGWHPHTALVDAANPGTIYVTGAASATQSNGAGGTFKSTDGGATWAQQSNHTPLRALVFDPNAPTTIYAHGVGAADVRRTEDSTASYAAFNLGLPSNAGSRGIAVTSGLGPRLLFASSAGGFQTSIPGPTCPADFNQSGTVTVQDIFDFLGAYFTGNLAADFNNSGTVTVQDIFDFLAEYFQPCP